MPNSLFNSRRTHPAVILSMYYEQHRAWGDYVYKGVRGLISISMKYDVPFSLLIARMKKGLSLHEAVTYGKNKEVETETRIKMSDVIANMKAMGTQIYVPSPINVNVKSKNQKGLGTYTVKVHKQGQSLPFPDKMSPLWRLALGLCPTR